MTVLIPAKGSKGCKFPGLSRKLAETGLENAICPELKLKSPCDYSGDNGKMPCLPIVLRDRGFTMDFCGQNSSCNYLSNDSQVAKIAQWCEGNGIEV